MTVFFQTVNTSSHSACQADEKENKQTFEERCQDVRVCFARCCGMCQRVKGHVVASSTVLNTFVPMTCVNKHIIPELLLSVWMCVCVYVQCAVSGLNTRWRQDKGAAESTAGSWIIIILNFTDAHWWKSQEITNHYQSVQPFVGFKCSILDLEENMSA